MTWRYNERNAVIIKKKKKKKKSNKDEEMKSELNKTQYLQYVVKIFQTEN